MKHLKPGLYDISHIGGLTTTSDDKIRIDWFKKEYPKAVIATNYKVRQIMLLCQRPKKINPKSKIKHNHTLEVCATF
jgi:hypothetical protein